MDIPKAIAEDGFVITKVDGCEELADRCLEKLQLYASKGAHPKFSGLASLGDMLVNTFRRDKDEYTGLLKAFANSPLVQSFACLPGIVSLAKSLGVREPTLVTPPILHVVKSDLILNREKVFTPAHQDVVSTKGSVGQIVFWIPLHSIERENYGIEAWPGSHLNGQLDVDHSEFGHTVAADKVPKLNPEYLTLAKGEVVAFSQYLIHRTFTNGTFRLAVSFRFNDALDSDWSTRKYFCAFDRVPNTIQYPDSRQVAPKNSQDYFNKLKS